MTHFSLHEIKRYGVNANIFVSTKFFDKENYLLS